MLRHLSCGVRCLSVFVVKLTDFDSLPGWILSNASEDQLSAYHERTVAYLAVDLNVDQKNSIATTMCLRLNLNIGSF